MSKIKPNENKEDSVEEYTPKELEYLDKYHLFTENNFDDEEIYDLIIKYNYDEVKIKRELTEMMKDAKKGDQYKWHEMGKKKKEEELQRQQHPYSGGYKKNHTSKYHNSNDEYIEGTRPERGSRGAYRGNVNNRGSYRGRGNGRGGKRHYEGQEQRERKEVEISHKVDNSKKELVTEEKKGVIADTRSSPIELPKVNNTTTAMTENAIPMTLTDLNRNEDIEEHVQIEEVKAPEYNKQQMKNIEPQTTSLFEITPKEEIEGLNNTNQEIFNGQIFNKEEVKPKKKKEKKKKIKPVIVIVPQKAIELTVKAIREPIPIQVPQIQETPKTTIPKPQSQQPQYPPQQPQQQQHSPMPYPYPVMMPIQQPSLNPNDPHPRFYYVMMPPYAPSPYDQYEDNTTNPNIKGKKPIQQSQPQTQNYPFPQPLPPQYNPYENPYGFPIPQMPLGYNVDPTHYQQSQGQQTRKNN